MATKSCFHVPIPYHVVTQQGEAPAFSLVKFPSFCYSKGSFRKRHANRRRIRRLVQPAGSSSPHGIRWVSETMMWSSPTQTKGVGGDSGGFNPLQESPPILSNPKGLPANSWSTDYRWAVPSQPGQETDPHGNAISSWRHMYQA